MGPQLLESSERFSDSWRGPGRHWYAKHTNCLFTHMHTNTHTHTIISWKCSMWSTTKTCNTHMQHQTEGNIEAYKQQTERIYTHMHTHPHTHTHACGSAVPTHLVLNNSAFLQQCSVNRWWRSYSGFAQQQRVQWGGHDLWGGSEQWGGCHNRNPNSS